MAKTQHPSIAEFNEGQSDDERAVCELLEKEIRTALPDAESKIWHAHPVWFFDGNPIVGYSKLKAGIRLMFWSGADFDEPGLTPGSGKFKDASATYQSADQVDVGDVRRWLHKAQEIEWDYRTLRTKHKLERIK